MIPLNIRSYEHATFHQQLHCHSVQLQLTPNIVKQLQPVIICKLFKMNVRVKVIYIIIRQS